MCVWESECVQYTTECLDSQTNGYLLAADFLLTIAVWRGLHLVAQNDQILRLADVELGLCSKHSNTDAAEHKWTSGHWIETKLEIQDIAQAVICRRIIEQRDFAAIAVAVVACDCDDVVDLDYYDGGISTEKYRFVWHTQAQQIRPTLNISKWSLTCPYTHRQKQSAPLESRQDLSYYNWVRWQQPQTTEHDQQTKLSWTHHHHHHQFSSTVMGDSVYSDVGLWANKS